VQNFKDRFRICNLMREKDRDRSYSIPVGDRSLLFHAVPKLQMLNERGVMQIERGGGSLFSILIGFTS
jgi:hypothetical protein